MKGLDQMTNSVVIKCRKKLSKFIKRCQGNKLSGAFVEMKEFGYL